MVKKLTKRDFMPLVIISLLAGFIGAMTVLWTGLYCGYPVMLILKRVIVMFYLTVPLFYVFMWILQEFLWSVIERKVLQILPTMVKEAKAEDMATPQTVQGKGEEEKATVQEDVTADIGSESSTPKNIDSSDDVQ